MKALIIHTKIFHIESVKKSTRPIDIVSIANNKNKIERNSSLVAFITIEKGDDELALEKMSLEISNIYEQVKSKKKVISILIIPFVHLSQNIEKPLKSHEKIKSLKESLTNRYPKAEIILGDFGFINSWGLEAYSHPLSCVFRET